MNPKQTAPLIAALAPLAAAIAPAIPALLVGGAALLVLNWLLSDDAKEKQPESVPADKPEIPRKIAETPVFRQIPAESPAKSVAIPRPSVPRVLVAPPAIPAIPTVAKIAAPVPVPTAVVVQKIVAQAPPPPVKTKFIAREDLAKVFQNGTRKLNRTAAVMELKKLGFGKTAAYAALSPHGRFATWLHGAPDGLISWMDAQNT
jgi:hypothetical protein